MIYGTSPWFVFFGQAAGSWEFLPSVRAVEGIVSGRVNLFVGQHSRGPCCGLRTSSSRLLPPVPDPTFHLCLPPSPESLIVGPKFISRSTPRHTLIHERTSSPSLLALNNQCRIQFPFEFHEGVTRRGDEVRLYLLKQEKFGHQRPLIHHDQSGELLIISGRRKYSVHAVLVILPR